MNEKKDLDSKDLALVGSLSILGLLIILPAIWIWNGYVLMILWRWFIIPISKLPSIGILEAMGIDLVVALLTFTPSMKRETNHWKTLAYAVGGPGFALIVGWIIQIFM